MDYLNYKAEDFAADESFIAYHLKRDPKAVAFWENWGRLNPEKLDEIAAAERLIDMLAIRLAQDEFDLERQKMQSFITDRQVIALTPTRKKYYWSLAASIFLILSISIAFLYKQRSQNNPEVAVEWLKHENPYGKKSRVRLPDGSVIVLNGGSTLHYPKSFSSQKRELKLDGEAYFSVAHDAGRPFIVHAGSLNTEVLGTEFNISAYDPDKNVSVSLVRGKVKVTTANDQAMLMPGQKVSYDASQKTLKESGFDIESETGWKEDKLVFKNADFATVAKGIQRTYGYKLVNQSPDKNWNYTGTFHQQSVIQVIENICFSKHLKYRINNKIIYLSAEK